MQLSRKSVVAIVTVAWNFIKIVESSNIKFINLECETNNKSYASFEKCYLKALARHNVSLNVFIKLHELPINDLKLNAQLLHKGAGYGGYRPYLYNNTMDFCRFMKTPSRWMFWKLVWDPVMQYSNLNHTCPLNHDVIIDGFNLRTDYIKLIPFPTNDYMLRLRFIAYNVYWVEVRSYISIYG